MFFGTCGLFFSHRRGRVENSFSFQMMYSFPSDSSSAVLSLQLDDRHFPIICHVALQVKKLAHHSLLRMFALRCPLRLKGLSSNPPGGHRASHACTNSSIFLLFAHCRHTLRLLRLLQHHHHALYFRVPSRPMESTTAL